MTTPNEELILKLRGQAYTNFRPDQLCDQAADLLQSQAERIKELEAENGKLSDLWSAMKAKRDELREKYTDTYWALDDAARENTSLRDQLAAIAAAEPVAYRWVWKSKPHDIEGWCYTSTPPNSPELQEIEKLFTRPMPAKPQDHEIRELVDRPAILFKPRLFPAGDQWCALFGEDLQTGVCGFGASAGDAMRDFDKEWNTKLKAGK